MTPVKEMNERELRLLQNEIARQYGLEPAPLKEDESETLTEKEQGDRSYGQGHH